MTIVSAKDVKISVSDTFTCGPVSFDVKPGEVISIIGPNGSGKSTLLRAISRLLPIEEGQFFLEGKNIASLQTKTFSRELTMLPQVLQQQVDCTVEQLVAVGREPYRRLFGGLTREDREQMEWAMEVTNVTSLRHQAVSTLSGGQRQRVWLAMCLAQNTRVLLLDEPTTYLDWVHQYEVLDIVKQINETKKVTVIMVLHDLQQAAMYSTRTIAMRSGQIVFDGPPNCVFCKEMFQQVFDLEVDLYELGGMPVFKPKCAAGFWCEQRKEA
ncbi:MAG: ABC transporter ATP-binding protein [Bacilli bacterium]